MEETKNYYVYYSYEQFGKGYIGYRKCPYGLTPETDNYFGSYSNKFFNPTEKIILFQDLCKEEASETEIKLHNFYNVKDNKHFANLSNANSTKFSYSNLGEKHPVYGKIKINDGINEKYISPGEEIPEGYILGRPLKVKQKCSVGSIGKKHSSKSKQKMSEDRLGDKHPNYGRIIINNGIEEKFIYPDTKIPEGYILGRCKKYGEIMSEINTGRIRINDGFTERHLKPEEEIPEGYILGCKPHSEKVRKNISKRTSGKNNPMYGQTHSDISKYKNKIKQGTRVISSICCYYSILDAMKELNITKSKFKKLFEKDSTGKFYIEKGNNLL